MAADGLRVLGVARASLVIAGLPEVQHDFLFEFIGLVGFADPIRPQVTEAVRECSTAGIRVIMITGTSLMAIPPDLRFVALPKADRLVRSNRPVAN